MLPTMTEGEWWLARRGRPIVGRVHLLRDPRVQRRWLVKRVIWQEPAGWWVEGDSSRASQDSRSFGPVPMSAIYGPLWRQYGPKVR